MDKNTRGPAELPADLAQLIQQPSSAGHQEWNGEKIPKGARDQTLFMMLCRWRDMGADWEMLVNAGVGFDQRFCDPPLGYDQVVVKVSSCLTRGARPEKPLAPGPLWGAAVAQYVSHLPPRVPMLGPFLTGQVGIMFAPPGVGKSLLLQFIADAIARGKGLGPWTGSGVERRALIVDGEMDARDVGQRLELLATPNVLGYALSETWAQAINLGSPAGQATLMGWAEGVDFIAADTTSALLWPTDDQADIWHPQVWLNTAPLRSWIRKTSRHLMWIDHANHANQLQGTKAKERDVDYVIKLTRPSESPGWLEMEMTWPKYRGQATTDTKPTTWSLRDGQLVGRIDLTTKERVARWREKNPNGKQVDCCRGTGLKRAIVSRYW